MVTRRTYTYAFDFRAHKMNIFTRTCLTSNRADSWGNFFFFVVVVVVLLFIIDNILRIDKQTGVNDTPKKLSYIKV